MKVAKAAARAPLTPAPSPLPAPTTPARSPSSSPSGFDGREAVPSPQRLGGLTYAPSATST
eukprot:4785543-Pyramimonas_sp.AAC.1